MATPITALSSRGTGRQHAGARGGSGVQSPFVQVHANCTLGCVLGRVLGEDHLGDGGVVGQLHREHGLYSNRGSRGRKLWFLSRPVVSPRAPTEARPAILTAISYPRYRIDDTNNDINNTGHGFVQERGKNIIWQAALLRHPLLGPASSVEEPMTR